MGHNMHACVHFKCTPGVSRGDALWHLVVEWVPHHSRVRISAASLAVLLDKLPFITAVLSIQSVNMPMLFILTL
jgi:hypothetical protein